MEYVISSIKIKDLIEMYKTEKLNLNPPYQRNAVWDNNSKKLLIDTIVNNFPLPNIFLHERQKAKFDMVDGQQRTRAILAYYNKTLSDTKGKYISDTNIEKFLDYDIPLVIITKIKKSEKIEAFYALVNSSGKRLNRPELLKAKYFDTYFIELAGELSVLPEFDNLNLFSEASHNRMNDLDFTAELIGLVKLGRTDKKNKVDDILEKDLSEAECNDVKEKFVSVIGKFARFNLIHPINKTRYKQRNDFYTLFDFINAHPDLPVKVLDHIYEELVLIDKAISPSNEKCEPLQTYAHNCVSQSNSKNARDERYRFMAEMFLNKFSTTSITLRKVLKYFGLKRSDLVNVKGYTMIDLETLKEAADI